MKKKKKIESLKKLKTASKAITKLKNEHQENIDKLITILDILAEKEE